jgi:hypothetical protein
MPCRDWGDYKESQEERDLRSEVDSKQKRLDKLTRILCEVEKHIPVQTFSKLSKEAQAWIQNHREADANAKKAAEREAESNRLQKLQKEKELRLKESAFSKLTAEERKVLGF